MAQIGRSRLSAAQRRDLWQRWKEGQTLREIGRALGRHPTSVHGVIKAHGTVVPPERSRAARVLSLAEREEISRGVARGESIRRIAAGLGRAPWGDQLRDRAPWREEEIPSRQRRRLCMA